jgi:alpha-tubulin suppressor-like RCC1 family protein
MPKLLLIDNRVRLTDIIISSIESDVDYVVFDYETETVDSFISKITIKPYECIGILQEQDTIPSYTLAKPMGDYDLNDYSTWTTYIELLQWCVSNLGIKFWDLIECNIDSTWQMVISSLQDQFNITIRSSSKQLGNTDVGDNWVFDDGTSLIGLYFTSAINEYPFTLGVGYSLGSSYVLDNNGIVYGQNSNLYGQLGIAPSSPISRWTQIAIPGSIAVVQVSTTNTGAVFLLTNGTCYACGYNYKYCLGLPVTQDVFPSTYTSLNTYTPTKIEIADVKYITCGLSHTIFLLRDGSVTVTGASSTGATCYGITTSNLTFLLKPNVLQDVYLITSMYQQTMFVYANKQNCIYFFGNNTTGSPSVATYTKLLLKESPVNIKQIECGGENMYYVDVSNNLYGIGINNLGQLGQGNLTRASSWVEITIPSNKVLKVSSSGPNLTILTLTGDIFFTGLAPGIGIPILNLATPWSAPVDDPGSTITNISDYYRNTCVAASLGSYPGGEKVFDVFSYLSNSAEQPYGGTGTRIRVFCIKNRSYFEISATINGASLGDAPILIDSTVPAVYFDAVQHTNEITSFRRTVSLINSDNGLFQIGYNPIANTTYSTFTNYTISGVTPKAVLHTNAGEIVLTNTNIAATSLYSYGNNLYGELGSGIGPVTGAGTHTLTVPYTGLTLSVFTGLYHSLFLLSDGKVYVTGLNNYGQLGLGNMTNLTSPTLGLTNIATCCCGLYSSYFLSNTGVVSVCGYNFNSELGSGSDLSSNTFSYFYKTPVQLKGIHTLLACGYYHSIKKLSDGTISAAGSNTYGQLGLGNTSPYNGYQKLTCPNFTGLFAGENRSAGLTSDGTLYAWGRTIGTTPLLTDINVSSVYQVTDLGIIYIKNSKYYVAYANDILAQYAYGPIPGIMPLNVNPLRIYSNICFLAGTPVKCDQGLIEIDKINPSVHTILGKKIVAITETHSTEKELVIIEKDSLRPNVPNQTTVVSMEHKIFYKGKMMEAYKVSKKRMNYNNEKLYNVLMEEHNKMNVNNMIVETLEPTNMIGKVFKGLREMI